MIPVEACLKDGIINKDSMEQHRGRNYGQRGMKVIMLLILICGFTACSKDHCNKVMITSQGTPCGKWAIRVNDKVYPVDTLPSSFQTEGITACADYELYQDMRMCPCCGGTWARINSIRHLAE